MSAPATPHPRLFRRHVAGALTITVALTLLFARCAHAPAGSQGVDGGLDVGPLDVTSEPMFTDSGPAPCTRCSADLHDLLDCDGGLVQHCAVDQGCAPSGCVSACEAAAANGGSAGCDFYMGTVAPEYETRGSCYAVMVTNTWTSPAAITVSHGGQSLTPTVIGRVPTGSGSSLVYSPLPPGGVPPGGLAVFFLSAYASGDDLTVSCPSGVKPGVSSSTAVDGTGRGTSFHLTTSAPVMAYDIYPFGGAASLISSASLLLPTAAWGTNYVVLDAYPYDPVLQTYNGYPYVQIHGQQDGTKVSIVAPVPIVGGGGLSAAGAHSTVTYTLNQGQFLQLMQDHDLSGSLITSNVPVGVVGGTSCMHIPIGYVACDSGHQQLWPVSGLGSEYVAVRYGNRPLWPEEIVPWRFIGAVDGTVLSYDPPQVGAPPGLNAEQVVEYDATGPFVVKSQDPAHPFAMSAHMTGCEGPGAPVGDAGNFDTIVGDPEFVTMLAPQQYLSHYTFLTDPTYGFTNLVFVRGVGADSAYHDVTLDCVGTLQGWTSIGTSPYQYTRVDLVLQGVPQGACNNGVHTASSSAPFGLTVWGYDYAVSYAYPAGGNVQHLNSVTLGPPPPM